MNKQILDKKGQTIKFLKKVVEKMLHEHSLKNVGSTNLTCKNVSNRVDKKIGIANILNKKDVKTDSPKREEVKGK